MMILWDVLFVELGKLNELYSKYLQEVINAINSYTKNIDEKIKSSMVYCILCHGKSVVL